jgi:Fe-S cluster biogenesis protein NfuA
MNKELESKILGALAEIRPYLQSDGGDITFISLNEKNEVRIKLLGSCGNCPMSIQTLKMGVERVIQKAVPQVIKVIAVDEYMEDLI